MSQITDVHKLLPEQSYVSLAQDGHIASDRMAAMLEPPAIVKATQRSSANMDNTPGFPSVMDDSPEFPVIMDTKPEFPVIICVAFKDEMAFSRHLRLASSLADPPMRLVRAAGIPSLQQ